MRAQTEEESGISDMFCKGFVAGVVMMIVLAVLAFNSGSIAFAVHGVCQ